MIRGNSIIRIIDVETGEHLACPISTVVSMYANMIKNTKNGIEVDFNNVKIQNWFGWTNLESIQKIYNPDVTWYDVTYRKHPEMTITMSNDERLMSYNPNRTMPTANGGSKYPVELISVENAYNLGLENPVILRSRYLNDAIDSPDQFVEATIKPAKNQNALQGSNGAYFGYVVRTSSGAYTIDSLHACGLSTEDLEGIYKRHKNFELFF